MEINTDLEKLRLDKKLSKAKRLSSAKKIRKLRMKKLKLIRNQYGCDPFFKTEQWSTLRYRTLALQKRKCQTCGMDSSNTRLHVDHIKPRSKYPELALEPSNLQVLCEACNIGKGTWEE